MRRSIGDDPRLVELTGPKLDSRSDPEAVVLSGACPEGDQLNPRRESPVPAVVAQ
jgi:hypothetical protein